MFDTKIIAKTGIQAIREVHRLNPGHLPTMVHLARLYVIDEEQHSAAREVIDVLEQELAGRFKQYVLFSDQFQNMSFLDECFLKWIEGLEMVQATHELFLEGNYSTAIACWCHIPHLMKDHLWVKLLGEVIQIGKREFDMLPGIGYAEIHAELNGAVHHWMEILDRALETCHTHPDLHQPVFGDLHELGFEILQRMDLFQTEDSDRSSRYWRQFQVATFVTAILIKNLLLTRESSLKIRHPEQLAYLSGFFMFRDEDEFEDYLEHLWDKYANHNF